MFTQERSVVPSNPHPTCLQKLINWLAGLYVLVMLIYLALRYSVQDGHWLLSLVNSFVFVLFLPLPVLLLLALLARSRRALFYMLPIMGVMLLWLMPRFLPKSVAVPTTPVLRVLSNNVWRDNWTPEWAAEYVLSSQPDVALLQEVDEADQDIIHRQLEDSYPNQNSLVDTVRLRLYTAYNITYSRLPFSEIEQASLGLDDMPFVNRSVIEWQGQPIALYNFHPVAPAGRQNRFQVGENYFTRVLMGFDDTQRNQQINALLQLLESEPYPYIVAGDFNTSDLSMTYNHIAAHMRDSFAEAGMGMGATWPMVEALGWPNFIPAFIRMDYIWHSDGLQTVRAWQGDYVGSDHLPMLAEFEVVQ